MNEERYLTERVDAQIAWYDQQSRKAQVKYKTFRTVEIISAAAIPVIAMWSIAAFPSNLVVAILGALIAVISALNELNQFNKLWIEYRATCEALKREKFLFLTQAEPYHQDNAFQYFTQSIEQLIAKENHTWLQHSRLNGQRKGAPTNGATVEE